MWRVKLTLRGEFIKIHTHTFIYILFCTDIERMSNESDHMLFLAFSKY